MKPHHLLVALLTLANTLGGAALIALVFAVWPRWPDAFAVITLGVGLGQLALAAAWLAGGRTPVVVRAGVFMSASLAWTWPLAICTGDTRRALNWEELQRLLDLFLRGERHPALWGGVLLLYGLCVAAPLVVVRLAGYSTNLEGEPPVAGHKTRSWQFTLGGILSLTTLAAIVLGVGRYVDFPWLRAVAACLFCTLSAAGAAASIFVALRAKESWLALAGPPLIGVLTGFLLRFTDFPPRPYEALIWMSLVQGATLALATAVLRTASYRLVRISSLPKS